MPHPLPSLHPCRVQPSPSLCSPSSSAGAPSHTPPSTAPRAQHPPALQLAADQHDERDQPNTSNHSPSTHLLFSSLQTSTMNVISRPSTNSQAAPSSRPYPGRTPCARPLRCLPWTQGMGAAAGRHQRLQVAWPWYMTMAAERGNGLVRPEPATAPPSTICLHPHQAVQPSPSLTWSRRGAAALVPAARLPGPHRLAPPAHIEAALSAKWAADASAAQGNRCRQPSPTAGAARRLHSPAAARAAMRPCPPGLR